jgi:hypothetical protein
MAKKKKAKAKPAKSAKKGAAKSKKSAKPAKASAKAAKAKPAKKSAKPTKKSAKPAKKTAKPAKAKTAHPQQEIDFEDEGPTFPGGIAPGSNGNGHAKASGVNLTTELMAMARTLYGNKPDAELLAFDPNDVDALDPSIFYELIQERFGIEGDESNSYFAGFGGPIKDLIAFVTKRWDGKTNNPVEMPPQDYLEEVVHDGD